MAKLNIGRIFEASRMLATEPGKILQEFITYMSDYAEQGVRALQNGLSFEDNFNATVKAVSLFHSIPQPINVGGKRVSGVIPLKAGSQTAPLDAFTWYIGSDSNLYVLANFVTTPANAIDCNLLILFN